MQIDDASKIIQTWQYLANSSVHEGGLLKAYLATTWRNTAETITEKRKTRITSVAFLMNFMRIT
jgi:hypothetical protein